MFKNGGRDDFINKRLDFEEVKRYIESFGYKLLDDKYENAHVKLNIQCDKGHIYKASFGKFKYTHRRCPICNNPSLKFEVVKDYIESFGHKLLSEEYVNSYTKLKIECEKGHVYEMTWDNFKQGSRCGMCTSSKGEKEIEKILNKYDIKFTSEYRFDDCVFYNCLPFDFYLNDYNVCIEYDGQEHHEIVKFWGGLDKFIDRKIRDTVKTIYCQNNNIKLIRIPYWDFNNIEEILKKELILNNK